MKSFDYIFSMFFFLLNSYVTHALVIEEIIKARCIFVRIYGFEVKKNKNKWKWLHKNCYTICFSPFFVCNLYEHRQIAWNVWSCYTHINYIIINLSMNGIQTYIIIMLMSFFNHFYRINTHTYIHSDHANSNKSNIHSKSKSDMKRNISTCFSFFVSVCALYIYIQNASQQTFCTM